ncbi:MAG: hypothetical protein GY711_10930 [bacterium]|nr:hypothetical protein [bacterium]
MSIRFCNAQGDPVGTPETVASDGDGNASGQGPLPAGATTWKASWQRSWETNGAQAAAGPSFARLEKFVYMGGPVATTAHAAPQGRLYAFAVMALSRPDADAIADSVLALGVQAGLPANVDVYFWAEGMASGSSPVLQEPRWILLEDKLIQSFALTWNGIPSETLSTVAYNGVVNGWHVLSDTIAIDSLDLGFDGTATNGFETSHEAGNGIIDASLRVSAL